MTITREWIEDFREGSSPSSAFGELCDLALIGLAVRDKEPGLVEAMAQAFAMDEGADSDPWVNYQDPETGLMVPYWHSYLSQASAALSAITTYRSE